MTDRRQTALWVGIALVGLVLAAALTTVAAQLSNQRVGLSSEPLTAGDKLAPAGSPAPAASRTEKPRATRTPRPKQTATPTPARTATPAPTRTAAPATGGHGSDDGPGDDHGGRRGGGGDD